MAHGGFGGQEPEGDLGGSESSDQTQRQRGAGLGSQAGVAGQEDEPKDVVLDVVDLAVEVGHLLLLSPAGAGPRQLASGSSEPERGLDRRFLGAHSGWRWPLAQANPYSPTTPDPLELVI